MKKHYLIFGLGATGLSCARYLQRKNQAFTVFDTRQSPPYEAQFRAEFPDVTLYCAHFPENQLTSIDGLFVSPSIALTHSALRPFLEKGVQQINEVDLFIASANAPVVAISGTNGKSTVTTWVGDMVKAAGKTVAVCGNIGWPMLDALREHWDAPPDFYVLELSSFQLEQAQACRTQTAVLLNCSDDHQNRHTDFAAYLAIKQKIYKNCDIPVLNADAPELWEGHVLLDRSFYFSHAPHRALGYFSLEDAGSEVYLVAEGQRLMPIRDLRVIGRHQAVNALASMALARAIGVSLEAVVVSLKRFTGLPHRCQWVARQGGVDWYNDSKATNIGACLAAVSSLHGLGDGRLLLLMGGEGKGADFSVLEASLRGRVAHVFLYGQDAGLIEAGIQGAVPITQADNLEAAVQLAAETAQEGDKVLLSPACASYDNFVNFEERGRMFQEAVMRLSNCHPGAGQDPEQ